MSNFSFLPTQWSALAPTLQQAEQHVYTAAPYAAVLCRKALEEWVRWIYENDKDFEQPYDTTLNSLLYQPKMRELLAPSLFTQVNLVRKLGNDAAHGTLTIRPEQALHVLQLLHGFTAWVVNMYSTERVAVPVFDVALVPQEAPAIRYQEKLREAEAAFRQTQDLNRQLQAELDRVKAAKESHAKLPPPADPNEAITRKLYIDLLLAEAGWDPEGPNVAEYKVTGMPTGNGQHNGAGRIDYVLWGDDGKPLAVVEAKRTSKDPKVGQHQAKLYADCLASSHGQRPVLFYTNGFETWLWDDAQYPPRRVHGFYKKDELALLIQRRTTRSPLTTAPIDPAIADRYYQIEAIRSVGRALEARHREALLVMATGTGKTRTAAALIDVLSKCGWAKRVLFLADRNALIFQAKKAFTKSLPNLPAVDLTKDKEHKQARVVFSTYQTMIHLIDQSYDQQQRTFGVGHFDLIVFDEIHRSVYNRYKAIFEYFDGYRVGLTATPRAEGDRDTYHLFGLEPGVPTFAYELDDAVSDGYLVPPLRVSVPLKFHRHGIKYHDLTPAEKLQYEEKFANPLTGEFPDEVDSGALNTWLFNEGTVNQVLAYLMTHGVKVAGGDRLGKTIIFARSHPHAKFIEERFNAQYPQYKGGFCKVIDNYETYAHDLLNEFSEKDKTPHIAVSVDMLDTGIDVPEVVNLVFYKPVRSSAKFWQMIGRGTRLCPGLLGDNQDKENFLIFDFCENFEFFDLKPKGIDARQGKSLTQRLFDQRLKLIFALQKHEEPEHQEYADELRQHLHKQVTLLEDESFLVRQHWRVVEKYRDVHQFNALNELDVKELMDHLAPIVFEAEQDELAKRFDQLCYTMELDVLKNGSIAAHLVLETRSLADALSKRTTIPMVAEKMPLIKQVQGAAYWTDVPLVKLEQLRHDLRHLMRFIQTDKRPPIYTNLDDEVLAVAEPQAIITKTNSLEAYRKRMTQFLQERRTHLTIHKLRTNQPIEAGELLALENLLFEQGEVGTRAQFEAAYGQQPLGKFVRSIVGLEATAVREAFSAFINTPSLNAQQIRFLDLIVQYLSSNGFLETEKLFEAPFTEVSAHGLLGVFNATQAGEVVSMLERVNQYAEAV
ncbi:DEAD/DEAH box helicase family protein [Hymenobacter sp. M29]|uniref:DEAD/DEAH box helicase family protein n=1 Tax=Hymenobacter mellowenesis TaxID=3063995 RepID=A0ABT9A8V7_9BACT|nr:DEAD/DEAH box helicase family protein [Hymenobacter sp. M29]MDO7846282.1 DEAD/DEAH box helicase family protein [Hymenobacter sp. M29]